MTENEAIKVLKMIETHGSLSTNAKKLSIQALEEVQVYRKHGLTVEYLQSLDEDEIQTLGDVLRTYSEWSRYKSIGTVEELKALKERDEPKKILNGGEVLKEVCPTCGRFISKMNVHYYCPCCGQKLDWQ